MKPCRVCGNNIPSEAKKCTHCDSYQNWRRYINFSSTVLALLVALISVVTASIPVIKNALNEPNSSIKILYKNFENNELTFIVSNSGDRSGGIGKAWLIMEVYKPTDQEIMSTKDSEYPFYRPGERFNTLTEVLKIKTSESRIRFKKLDNSDPVELQFSFKTLMFDPLRKIPMEAFLKENTSYLLKLELDENNDRVFISITKGGKRPYHSLYPLRKMSKKIHPLITHPKDNCYMRFEVINFDGTRKYEESKLRCTEISLYLNNFYKKNYGEN